MYTKRATKSLTTDSYNIVRREKKYNELQKLYVSRDKNAPFHPSQLMDPFWYKNSGDYAEKRKGGQEPERRKIDNTTLGNIYFDPEWKTTSSRPG